MLDPLVGEVKRLEVLAERSRTLLDRSSWAREWRMATKLERLVWRCRPNVGSWCVEGRGRVLEEDGGEENWSSLER
jgi:hypothetical protein